MPSILTLRSIDGIFHSTRWFVCSISILMNISLSGPPLRFYHAWKFIDENSIRKSLPASLFSRRAIIVLFSCFHSYFRALPSHMKSLASSYFACYSVYRRHTYEAVILNFNAAIHHSFYFSPPRAWWYKYWLRLCVTGAHHLVIEASQPMRCADEIWNDMLLINRIYAVSRLGRFTQ